MYFTGNKQFLERLHASLESLSLNEVPTWLLCSPVPQLSHQANSVVVFDLLPLSPHLAYSDRTVSHPWTPTHA